MQIPFNKLVGDITMAITVTGMEIVIGGTAVVIIGLITGHTIGRTTGPIILTTPITATTGTTIPITARVITMGITGDTVAASPSSCSSNRRAVSATHGRSFALWSAIAQSDQAAPSGCI